MPVSDSESRDQARHSPSLAARINGLLDDLPRSDEIVTSRHEGEAINEILEPLNLPEVLQGAISVYPLEKNGLLPAKFLTRCGNREIPDLVQGLVQLGRFSLPADWRPGEALATHQSEALRKMLLAVVSDSRLVIVRVAEQLHRLRAAKKAPRQEQRALAVETQEIYAALANRLGVWQLKWELEDLAFRYLEPETYKEVAGALREKRVERESFVEEVRVTVAEMLAENGIEATVTGRPKHIFSIYRKMQQKHRAVEDIFDMRAIRVLVDDVNQCYAALGVVHNMWPYLPGEFDDYIANPKNNNYQSLHTAVIGPEGKSLEVQIRTHEMHRHAELGVAAHWRYKEGGATRAAFDRKIQFLRQLLEPGNQDGDLLDQIRGDVFEDRVYAISPKGDVVEMPSGSTPLDFAYHVHTQVGHRCRGAKVNGRIVPLTYRIQNGDKVEIITGKNEQPSRDWLSLQLGYLAASRSRTKVRNWFRQRDKDQNKKLGRDLFDRELARLNMRDVSIDKIVAQLKFDSTEALCIALGAGDLTPAAIASALQNLRRGDDLPSVRRRRHPKSKGKDEIAISGVGDLLCNYARCCRPVPPEEIAGYITLGRGVSIHRKDCGNFLSLQQRHSDRVIEVDWGKSADAIYPANLTLHAFDRQGLLRDISSVLADEHIAIDKMNTSSDKRTLQVVMEIGISVPGLPTLSRVISKLEQLPNVTSVRRAS